MRNLVLVVGCLGCDIPHHVTIPRGEMSRISDRGEVMLVARGEPEIIELDCVRIPTADLSLGFTPQGRRTFGGCEDGRLGDLLERAEHDPRWTRAEVEFRKTSGRQVVAGVLGSAIGAGLGVLASYVAVRCQPMAGVEGDDQCDGHDIVAPFAYILLGALGGAVGYGAGSLLAQDQYRLR